MRYTTTLEVMNPDVPSPTSQVSETPDYRKPPSVHWALVLLYHMSTFGIFDVIWGFRQAAWVRRLDPTRNAIFILVVAFCVAHHFNGRCGRAINGIPSAVGTWAALWQPLGRSL
jgi:hypothetical protein